MFMEPTMRWYGPEDQVPLSFIRQAGCTGVVTSLHQIPYGEKWSEEAIRERQMTVDKAGMTWSVVESLPVHEFHHWDTTANGEAFAAAKADGRQWACGFANEHLYAGFPHLYWAGTPLPKRFADAAGRYIKERT